MLSNLPLVDGRKFPVTYARSRCAGVHIQNKQLLFAEGCGPRP